MSVIKTGYDKRAIKAALVLPDACAWLLVQLAYAQLLHTRGRKRQGGTYESATTRRFFKGRTEVVRAVTRERDAFVRAITEEPEDGKDKEKADVDVQNTKKLFELAAKARGVDAQAVDRHMLGECQLIPPSSSH